jgi:protocatechuate 3,4-dioxygenase beta subunit
MEPADDHHGGLAHDVATIVGRRRALQLLGGVGLIALVGCSDDDATTAGDGSTSTAGGTATTSGSPSTTGTTPAGDCEALPEETAGPYPGDGSNGPDVLSESGVVRSDIRSSFGSASGTAEGVELVLDLTVLAADGCTPLSGAAVYLWHCDAEGRYSLYSEGAEDQNYLRGVQEAGADGKVRFTSIFPGAYAGRWPHIHFEVYESLDAATSGGDPRATSQLALPEDPCTLVYATSGYEDSVSNLAQTSLDSDNVFRDGYDAQLATVTGSVAAGYTAALALPV